MIDRDEYQRLKDTRRAVQMAQFEGQFKQLAQAEVPADKITGSPEWDWFVRILQAKLEASISDLEALNAQVNVNHTMTTDQLIQAHGIAMKLVQRIETLKEVIDMPAAIRSDAKSAKKMLDEVQRAKANGQGGSVSAS